ncbi:MAG: integrase core domain-containing protein [Spirochaetales bacterium]|nr:integrase core domain-containing protein [Spirochaetales bacterium]
MFTIKNLFSLLYLFIISVLDSNRLLLRCAVILKENECLKRALENHEIKRPYDTKDKRFFRFLALIDKNITQYISFVTPKTVIHGWKSLCNKRWVAKKRKPGRPPLEKRVKDLILNMKILNRMWGYKRISDELEKLDISVCKKTIANVIQNGRKEGLILTVGLWKQFLLSHMKFLHSCDFFTVDLLGLKRFYIFFIIKIETREIVHWNITQSPTIAFLRRQISHFEEKYPGAVLIHDNSGELKWFPYEEYEIRDQATVPYSPNMNAFAERFIRSIRTECLDWFIILNGKHLRVLLKKYMHYYNNFRPHQGIGRIPCGKPPDCKGKIKKQSFLFGLHHHYYRSAS